MKIKGTIVLKKMLDAQDAGVIVNEGGSRSSKTISTMQYLIIQALTKPVKITVCRQKLTWLRDTVYKDFQEVMRWCGLWNNEKLNKSELVYNFDNGSEFTFAGLDDTGKLHGRKQDYTWINEAIQVDESSFTQLEIRTNKQMILDYNPSRTRHWIYENIIPRPDCVYIKSRPCDNSFLQPKIIKALRNLKGNEYRVYWLGERSKPEDAIYQNWEIVKSFDAFRIREKFYGLDYGWTAPTAAIEINLVGEKELAIRTIMYKPGLSVAGIYERFQKAEVSPYTEIYSDSASPRESEELYQMGLNVQPVNKSTKTVFAGIRELQGYKLFVLEDDYPLINELENYNWKKDKNGYIIESPEKGFDHLLDALRYGVVSHFY